MKNIILILGMLIFSGSALAANSGWVKIKSFITDEPGHISVYVNAAYKGTPSCPQPSRYVLASSNPAFKNNYAMLLTAWTNGNEIYLALKNDECIYSAPVIRWMRVR